MASHVFATDRRIRLGIWGLGRGGAFWNLCRDLHLDVVAGCDFNPHLRDAFRRDHPGALATADADEFLAAGIDAVLLATFCPQHAEDAIRCLRAGKHVLSEVTAFHTPGEGVRLVEAVEASGLVYNLAENYPFSAANMWLAEQWRAGLFGELMYAEYEYLHELRALSYTYLDGTPIAPDGALHSWRSWLDYHFYCTHSLGPVMVITGTRPTRVVSLPGAHTLPGFPVRRDAGRGGLGGVAPSLMTMSNGAVVRNLMGGTSGDAHVQRLWGTRGSATQGAGTTLSLRLGGHGGSPVMEVRPSWPELGGMAGATGHGGGDFWVLYYFARQILTGERAPWDIHAAADVTLPGILAYRSAMEDGRAYDIPDFRDPAQRDAWRDDDRGQVRIDPRRHLFGGVGDERMRGFNAVMKALIDHSQSYRAWADWTRVADAVVDGRRIADLARDLAARHGAMVATYRQARALAGSNAGSEGARALDELLDVGGEREVLATGFLAGLERNIADLDQRFPAQRQG